MNKKEKIIFSIVTGLFSLMMLLSAGMYFFNHEEISKVFEGLGFPTFIIYPLAIAKILGLVAIWTNKSAMLREWAYAGFTFNMLLALSAHANLSDGDQFGAIMGLILMGISYYVGRKREKPLVW